LPRAWNRLVGNPDETLVQLLKESTEKICGYEIEPETVIRFLEQNEDVLIVQDTSRINVALSVTSPRKPIITPPSREGGRAKGTTLRVVINWQQTDKAQTAEVLENDQAVRIFLRALERIANHVGPSRFGELLKYRVNRGMLLAKDRDKYHCNEILGFYVLTYNATAEKAQILVDVASKLGLPRDFLQVEIVE
jgi:hypothetical protein